MLTRVFSFGSAVVDGVLVRGDVAIAGGRIAAIGTDVETFLETLDPNDDVERVDCTGRVIAPGFIDLQCNGAVGLDITTQPDAIGRIAEALPRFGVTSWLPTVVTCPAVDRRTAIEAMLALRSESGGAGAEGRNLRAEPIGLHFEGPMISPNHVGAHVPRHVATPSVDELDAWVSSGVVSFVTLAPELPGAIDVIRHLSDGGIVISAGHTRMTPEDLIAARSAGLSYATHLFNAMAPFRHRAPGPIGSILADPTLVAGIIADGLHVDPVAVRMAWNTLGPSRMSLVSDAVGALGMPFGPLHVGDFEIMYDETGVRIAGGVLAGSALALDQAVRNLIAWTGCSLVDALATVTTTPADLLGLTDRGRVAVGMRADLVILDEAANLHGTMIGGQSVRDRNEPRR